MTEPIRRALISVSDKTDLAELGAFLAGHGVEILSTGGSTRLLKDAGVPVIEVSDFTGFPEIMDGRVKTLQPKIHGGLLAVRANADHQKAMADHGIQPIDLLVVNLYPFEATVAKGAEFDDCIENIDIGGPALIRAAAKNHGDVTVVVDAADYGKLMEEMAANSGATTRDFRKHLAATAYARTAAYDAAISGWFAGQLGDTFPTRLTFAGERRQVLRYGENPHQTAAFYAGGPARPGIATAEQLQGKELSFNNLNDTDAAFELVAEFADQPACVIVKHANPCGVAVAGNLMDAYDRAHAVDPTSAFGGIIAFNCKLDRAAAEAVAAQFLEVLIAPDYTDDALELLRSKQNVRVLACTPGRPSGVLDCKRVGGGLLVQSADDAHIHLSELKCVTRREPTGQELHDMLFAWRVAKYVKSNAIVYCRDGMTVGVGAGQMSRVDSARIAAIKADNAGLTVRGSVVASDAFFPFRDGLDVLAQAGATAVIQPGGSMRDAEVIAAADEHGIAMVFTGFRHFRH